MPATPPAAATPEAAGATGAIDHGDGTVTFRLFGSARAAAGAGEIHVAAGPTPEVLADLAASLPPRFAHVLTISSLVADGSRLDRASSAPIAGGTVVDVLPPFAGG